MHIIFLKGLTIAYYIYYIYLGSILILLGSATKLKLKEIFIFPDCKFCSSCHQKAEGGRGAGNYPSNDESDSSLVELKFDRNVQGQSNASSSLETLDISPLLNFTVVHKQKRLFF